MADSITVKAADLTEVGKNVRAAMVDGKLVIVVDPNVNLGPSKTSGKMLGVASTGGFALLPAGLKGNVWIGRSRT